MPRTAVSAGKYMILNFLVLKRGVVTIQAAWKQNGIIHFREGI